VLASEKSLVVNFKKIFLLTAGIAVQRYRDQLSEQQEILSLLSDLVISIFEAESVLLRAQKVAARSSEKRTDLQTKAAQLIVHAKSWEVESKAKQILAAVSDGDELRTHLAALRRFTRSTPVNLIALRQAIARKLAEEGKYCLS